MVELLKKFRPSNGTEGDIFMEKWCHCCARDKLANGSVDDDYVADDDFCPILGDTMAYSVDDPRYPGEWTFRHGVPVCTAWVPVDKPVPVPRCDHTPDMFDG